MRRVKSGINFLLVIVFVLLGLVGLAIPFVPQVIFFVLALVFLSFEVPSVSAWIEKKLGKENAVGKMYYAIHQVMKKYFG
jgi:uncharacterized membrane protein YbaN (DUF454 family)